MSEYEYYLEMFTADGKYIIKNAEGEVVEAEPLARLDAFKRRGRGRRRRGTGRRRRRRRRCRRRRMMYGLLMSLSL